MRRTGVVTPFNALTGSNLADMGRTRRVQQQVIAAGTPGRDVIT